jgi:hypothetical protein
MSENVVLGVAGLGSSGSLAVVLEASTGREIATASGPSIPGW